MNYEYWQLVEMKERIESGEKFSFTLVCNIEENMDCEIEDNEGSVKYLEQCKKLREVARQYIADNF